MMSSIIIAGLAGIIIWGGVWIIGVVHSGVNSGWIWWCIWMSWYIKWSGLLQNSCKMEWLWQFGGGWLTWRSTVVQYKKLKAGWALVPCSVLEVLASWMQLFILYLSFDMRSNLFLLIKGCRA
jgi:hypothetical protein